MMTKIEFHLDQMNPADTGWYILDYEKFDEEPVSRTGPYETQTQAIRMLREATDKPDGRERIYVGHKE